MSASKKIVGHNLEHNSSDTVLARCARLMSATVLTCAVDPGHRHLWKHRAFSEQVRATPPQQRRTCKALHTAQTTLNQKTSSSIAESAQAGVALSTSCSLSTRWMPTSIMKVAALSLPLLRRQRMTTWHKNSCPALSALHIDIRIVLGHSSTSVSKQERTLASSSQAPHDSLKRRAKASSRT